MTATWMSGAAPRQAAAIPGPAAHPIAWYTVAGALTTGLQEVLFLGTRPLLGALAANVLALALTTIANTEFQRRVTFAGSPASPLRVHLQSVGTFAFYAGYGSVVLLSLHLFTPAPSAAVQAVALALASALGGLARFAVLRWWVFPPR
ncbi:GtrA family protein [Amycolatopsis granulosa]|uniref:GtrA family protein n=1 Tax=Amycolatopsis granulosa TaxID=185684 RepID=UPI0014219761|nr:GtrA family protein [Amycolatopsis granulosa]NIH87627.1 putative flippase GtrA [Amycolatopsis granulosa]